MSQYIRYPTPGPSLPLSQANGGTGLSSGGSANQVLGENSTATALEYKTIAGTSNQLTVSNATNLITLALSNTAVTPSTYGSSSQSATITVDQQGRITAASNTAIDHNALANLTTGDPHTQYALLAGRSGGQTLIGGTAASNNLILQSTSNGTRGNVISNDQLEYFANGAGTGNAIVFGKDNKNLIVGTSNLWIGFGDPSTATSTAGIGTTGAANLFVGIAPSAGVNIAWNMASGGTNYYSNSSGSPIKPITDNVNDFGSAAQRWRDLYLGGNLHLNGTIEDVGYEVFTATNGGSSTLSNLLLYHVLNSSGNLVTYNVNLPSGTDGALLNITTNNAIATLTIAPAGGDTIANGTIVIPAGGGAVRLIYIGGAVKIWFPA